MGLRPTYTTLETHPCTADRHEFGVTKAGINRCRCGERTIEETKDASCETILLTKTNG